MTAKEYRKQWRIKNAESIKAYRESRKEKRKEYDRQRYLKNPEIFKERSRKRRLNIIDIKPIVGQKEVDYKKEFAEYEAKKRQNPQYKVLSNLRRRINHVIDGRNKSKKSEELLGCSIENFIKHIESQFKDGMTWENYGRNGWHIDHIVPCNLFDLTQEYQQKSCFNYQNMQPLWEHDNISKSDKLEICPV